MSPASENHIATVTRGITKRAVKACAACRARKSRCDTRLARCSHCAKHKLRCDYESAIIRLPPAKSFKSNACHDRLLREILDRLDRLDSQISQLSDPFVLGSSGPLDRQTERVNNLNEENTQLEERLDGISPAAIPSVKCNSASQGTVSYSKWWKNTLEDTLEWPILGFKGRTRDAIETTIVPCNTGSLNCESMGDGLGDRDVIPHLVKLFIEEFHTKNPVLDIPQVQKDLDHVLSEEFGYNETSCFVLLYCALGSISCNFSAPTLHTFTNDCTSALRYANHAHYFIAAQERFGFLWTKSRLRHAQGLFLAGIYLMYDLKPCQALETFTMASNSCYSHMMTVRATRRLDGDDSDAFPRNEDQKFRPCEQRLYWSCLKSETELAHEYGLETSTIGQLTDPPSLPTPPDPLTVENILTSMFITTPSDTTALAEVQEKSWYYYLTEITLRKLEIQIHASFERLHDEEWPLPIETMSPVEKTRLQDFLQCIISGITEFETQLRSCWERLGSAMDIDLNDVTIGCPDELAEYLRIKFYWIKHDLLRIALTIILYFESTSASTLSRGESSLSTEFPSLSEVLFGMANRGLVVSVTIMQVAMNTHRNHGSCFGPMIAVMGALEVIAARRFEKPGLVVPWKFEDAAKSLVDGLKWWEPGMPDAGEYLKILASLDPVFEHGY